MPGPLLLLSLAGLAAGSPPPDTLRPVPWGGYAPSRLLLHTAGGQGMAAAGLGWTALHNRLALEVLAGYLPKSYSITPVGIFTAKASYAPWQLRVGASRWQVQPLALGGLVSHSVSDGIRSTWHPRYQPKYYWWSAKTRLGAFVGGSAGYAFAPSRRGYARSVAAYYELGSNDLYLASYWKNWDALPFSAILTLGLGLRVQLW